MSFHLITCLDGTTWSMSSEAFTIKLKECWPDAVIAPGKIPGITLRWRISIDDFSINGSFHENGLTVGLNGPFEGFAIFACWYRTLVSPEVSLVLMDEGYSTIYPLTAETTVDDIVSGRIATEPPS